jgi:hypothetical protein
VDNLKVGSKVSVDHFDIRLKGRTCDSYGKPSSTQYVEGALFVEDASGYIKCEHQVDFSAVETLRANQTLNGIADQGIFFQDYLTDNGAFKANFLWLTSMSPSSFFAFAAQMRITKMVWPNGPFN